MQLNLNEIEQSILSEELGKLRKAILENEQKKASLGIPGKITDKGDGALLFVAVQELLCRTMKTKRKLRKLTEKGGQDVGGKYIHTAG